MARVYDLGLVDQWRNYHAIEVKQVRTGYGWSFAELSEDQEANLLDATRVGWAWLVIHHVARLSQNQRSQWRVENLNRAWAIPIHAALRARDQEGYNTLTPDWCEDNGLRLMSRGEWSWADFLDRASLLQEVGV